MKKAMVCILVVVLCAFMMLINAQTINGGIVDATSTIQCYDEDFCAVTNLPN